MTSLSRRISFSSAHRYYQSGFSEEKNRRIYGKYFSEHGHGHNYILDVTVTGQTNPETGMIINLRELDAILREIIEPLDHHHLNFDVPAFKEIVPTTENVARYCFDQIRTRLPSHIKLLRTRLFENEMLWADFYG